MSDSPDRRLVKIDDWSYWVTVDGARIGKVGATVPRGEWRWRWWHQATDTRSDRWWRSRQSAAMALVDEHDA